jgi:hypothetical protein
VTRVAVVVLGVLIPSLAAAQAPARMELGGGVRWLGASDLASELSNQVRPGGGERAVFHSATTIDAALGVEGRLGVRMTRRLLVEGTLLFNPTHMTTRATGDVESAADTSATTPLSEYVAQGGLCYDLRRDRRGRVMPIFLVGGGYLRQVSRDNVLVEDGRSYYVGLGFDVAGRASVTNRASRFGVRVDVTAVASQNGFGASDTVRVRPTLAGSLYTRF